MKNKFNPVYESYENGKCPDCFEKIPKNVKHGEACKNCGHVFYDEFSDFETFEEMDKWLKDNDCKMEFSKDLI